MNIFDSKALLVEFLKKEEKLRPPLGELYQGIIYALLNAKCNFESAEILFKEGKQPNAFVLCVAAMEELGKVNRLASTMTGWDGQKLNEYLTRQKSHPWKLSAAIELVQSIFKSASNKLSIKPDSTLTGFASESDIFEMLANQLDPKAAKEYHKLRLDLGYTNFEENKAKSPYHHLSKINPTYLMSASSVIAGVIDGLLKVHEKIIPGLHFIIVDSFYSTDQNKVAELKFETNRQFRRIMPSLRKSFCESSMKNTGMTGSDWWDRYGNDVYSIPNLANLDLRLADIKELISSHEEIEEIYFYPPLKEDAKQFYLSKFAKKSKE